MVLAVIQKQRTGFRHILVLVPGQHDVPVFHAVAHGHAAHVGIRMLVQHRLGQDGDRVVFDTSSTMKSHWELSRANFGRKPAAWQASTICSWRMKS